MNKKLLEIKEDCLKKIKINQKRSNFYANIRLLLFFLCPAGQSESLTSLRGSSNACSSSLSCSSSTTVLTSFIFIISFSRSTVCISGRFRMDTDHSGKLSFLCGLSAHGMPSRPCLFLLLLQPVLFPLSVPS